MIAFAPAFTISVAAAALRRVARQNEVPGGRLIDDKAPGGRPPALDIRTAVADDERNDLRGQRGEADILMIATLMRQISAGKALVEEGESLVRPAASRIGRCSTTVVTEMPVVGTYTSSIEK